MQCLPYDKVMPQHRNRFNSTNFKTSIHSKIWFDKFRCVCISVFFSVLTCSEYTNIKNNSANIYKLIFVLFVR